MTAKSVQQSATKAIRLLRNEKHSLGLPFMINSDILASDQCFLEYPDGSIKIAEAASREKDFIIVFEFDLKGSAELRKRLKLQ